MDSNPAKSPSAHARDETIIRLHINPYIGNNRVGAITSVRIQKSVTQWCKTAKPRTVRRQYDTLRAIFGAAADGGLIARSPCRKIHLPDAEPVVRDVIDADELELLSFALGPRFALMPYLATELGLRWGEVAGLRVCDVEFAAKRVCVRQQRTRGKGAQMVTREPKSEAGRRHIAASASLLKMVSGHLALRGVSDLGSTELLIVGRNGMGLSYSNWYHQAWVPATLKISRAGLQFHDLRRTNATGLVQAGVDIKTAQVRLGHSDPRLTIGVYAQATPAADRDAAERLESRFRPGQSERVHRSRDQNVTSPRGAKNQGTSKGALNRKKIGQEGGIRTRDLSVPKSVEPDEDEST